MNNFVTIVFRLTVSCLLAASVMGICFIFTSNAKKHNEHVKEQQVMYELLGYKAGVERPASLAMHEIYRYVVSSTDRQSIGYLVPGKEDGECGFLFVNIDLDGQLIASKPVQLSAMEPLKPNPVTGRCRLWPEPARWSPSPIRPSLSPTAVSGSPT